MSSYNSKANSYFSDLSRAYWDDICDTKPLSLDEQRRLIKLIKAGDKAAQDAFIESFLRLVVDRAKKYCYNFDSFMDMVQEGNLGLIKAIEGFDPDKGCNFSTYATYWIDKYIRQESCRTGRPICIPPDMRQAINRLLVIEDEFLQIHNRFPSVEELADIMNMSIQQITELKTFSTPILSLDYEINSHSDSKQTLLDSLPDSQNLSPENIIISKDTKSILEKFMKDNLTDIEYMILKLRLGFTSEEDPKTLVEVSEICGISFQGVRKAEIRAINKLQKVIMKTGLTRVDFE